MRGALVRSGLPLLVLLVAVLAHTGLGAVLNCPPVEGARSAPVAVAAATTALPDADICPGCTSAGEDADESAGGAASPSPADAAAASSPALAHDVCTSDRPCHDRPANRHGPTEAAVRAVDAAQFTASAVLPVCTVPFRPDRSAAAPDGVAPVSAAALEPVAVLCVNRN